jgi:hypothetical protein
LLLCWLVRTRKHASQPKFVASMQSEQPKEKETIMLYTIVAVLLVLWLLGLVTSYTLGGFIHLLLAVAIVMVLVNFISRRKQA